MGSEVRVSADSQRVRSIKLTYYRVHTYSLFDRRLTGYSIRIGLKIICTGELGYEGPLYDGFLQMTDDMLGPSPMHIKYSSYVYDGFCI